MTASMTKRQALILGGLIVIAIAEVVKVNDLTLWHQLIDVNLLGVDVRRSNDGSRIPAEVRWAPSAGRR